jgi:hypothetical protein
MEENQQKMSSGHSQDPEPESCIQCDGVLLEERGNASNTAILNSLGVSSQQHQMELLPPCACNVFLCTEEK